MSDMQKEIVNFLVLDDLWKRWQHMRFPLKWGEKIYIASLFHFNAIIEGSVVVFKSNSQMLG